MPLQTPLNQSIQTGMAHAGVSQTDIADAIGVTQPTVSRRLASPTDDWTVRELITIAELLGIGLSDLLVSPMRASA